MNKGNFNTVKLVLMVSAILASHVGGFVSGIFDSGSIKTRTPSSPHQHHQRTKAHAPNDGRWHMKFHRSRR